MIFGTEGHIADGTNPKATPRMSIITTASTHELSGRAILRVPESETTADNHQRGTLAILVTYATEDW